MKHIRLILLIAFVAIVSATHAQIQYTVNKVADGTVNSNKQLSIGSFRQLPKRFVAYLYNDALVFDEGFDGAGNTYYKFVRKIDMPDRQRWNALDRYGNAFIIIVKDFDTYTLIAIQPMNSNKVTVYQTL